MTRRPPNMPPADHTFGWTVGLIVLIMAGLGSFAMPVAVAVVAAWVVIGSVVAVANGPGNPRNR